MEDTTEVKKTGGGWDQFFSAILRIVVVTAVVAMILDGSLHPVKWTGALEALIGISLILFYFDARISEAQKMIRELSDRKNPSPKDDSVPVENWAP